MSISVNPPPQQNLPKKILDDKELRPFFLYQQEYLFKLWQRTGGGTDTISDHQDDIDTINAEITAIKVRLDAIEADIVAIKARLDALEALTFIQVTATANHTTTRNEIITCTNTSAITVFANATPNTIPAANEEIHVMRAGSRVRVDGNGKLIMGVSGGNDGVSSFDLNIKGQGVQMIFNTDTDKWHIQ